MKDFTQLLRVRYSECDAQQIVFNGKYAEYVDVAATEFMRAVWGEYKKVLAMGIDSQVVNLTISWKAPAVFDDVLAISVIATHIGNTSYTLAFSISNHATGLEIAHAETVYVAVSISEAGKIPIPTDLKEKLQNGAPGVIVNHAGV